MSACVRVCVVVLFPLLLLPVSVPSHVPVLTPTPNRYGTKKWALIADHLPGRKGKACRERFRNQLDPTIKKTPWTEHEDSLLLSEQAARGNKYVEVWGSNIHVKME